MEDLYFKNHEARIIFGLVVLSQKMQMDFLGIDYNHYSDKKIAEIWTQISKMFWWLVNMK